MSNKNNIPAKNHFNNMKKFKWLLISLSIIALLILDNVKANIP